jgi:hypothetical protein
MSGLKYMELRATRYLAYEENRTKSAKFCSQLKLRSFNEVNRYRGDQSFSCSHVLPPTLFGRFL